jgi:hypothetical protein
MREARQANARSKIGQMREARQGRCERQARADARAKGRANARPRQGKADAPCK